MKTVFVDTFYWTALTSTEDRFHRRAVDFSLSMRPEKLITTYEVLDEYLAFFSGARQSIRTKAGNYVARLLETSGVTVIPQSRESFLAGLELYAPAQTRATA